MRADGSRRSVANGAGRITLRVEFGAEFVRADSAHKSAATTTASPATLTRCQRGTAIRSRRLGAEAVEAGAPAGAPMPPRATPAAARSHVASTAAAMRSGDDHARSEYCAQASNARMSPHQQQDRLGVTALSSMYQKPKPARQHQQCFERTSPAGCGNSATRIP